MGKKSGFDRNENRVTPPATHTKAAIELGRSLTHKHCLHFFISHQISLFPGRRNSH